jgi:hypothetical protein
VELNGDVINGRSELGGDQLGGWTWARLLNDPIVVYGDVDWNTLILATGDPVTVTDFPTKLFPRLKEEATVIGDYRFKATQLHPEETVSVVDAGINYAQVLTVSSVIAFFDEFIKSVVLGGGGGGITITRVKDDFITLTDGLVSWVYRRRDLSELLTLLDNTATARSYIKQAIENLVVADSTLAYHFWRRQAEDDLTIADQVLKALRDVRMMIDTITANDDTFNWKRRTGYATEIITVTDELKFWRRMVRVNDELLTLIDGFVKTLVTGGGVINTRITTDAVEMTDAFGRVRQRVTVASEALVFSEQTIRALARIRYIAESVDITDGYATVRIRRALLSELLGIPDEVLKVYMSGSMVYYEVRIRIAADIAAVLGYDSDIRVSAEYPIALGNDEFNWIGSRADNQLGAYA